MSSQLTPWICLLLAGFFEIVWAYYLKQSHGLTRPVPTLITLVGMVLSFGLLAQAMKTIPLGTAYTLWTGIGAVGAFAVGILFLGEHLTLTRLVAATLIVAGLILMKLSAPPA
jgi:quaternary ammonium compound-resistance protein SugE